MYTNNSRRCDASVAIDYWLLIIQAKQTTTKENSFRFHVLHIFIRYFSENLKGFPARFLLSSNMITLTTKYKTKRTQVKLGIVICSKTLA